jgi:hypothetical protein
LHLAQGRKRDSPHSSNPREGNKKREIDKLCYENEDGEEDEDGY